MTDTPIAPEGTILRAENGDVIAYDRSGLLLRLSDRVIADIAARLRLAPETPGGASGSAPGGAPREAEVAELPDDLDAWAIRAEGDWIAFQANLPGADSARGYRRHREGGAILAEARGPLLGILGIGGARAGLASPGASRFPYHVFGPADDIGAVGMGGEGDAPATPALQPLREVTQEALLAETLLARRAEARQSLPLFFTRAESDSAATAGDLGTGAAFANFERAVANLVAAATRLGTRAQLLAVTLDYVLEDLSGDPLAYRDGILALMERITRALGRHGLPAPVFLTAFDCGTHEITEGPALAGQWELSWNHGEHQLVFTCPSYAFALDDTARLTEEGRRTKAEIAAEALSLVQEGGRWLCPTIQLAEREGDDIRLICEAAEPLVLDKADPFGAGPLHGFRLDGVTNGAELLSVEIDAKDRKSLILRCSRRPEGVVEVAYAFAAAPGSGQGPYPANAGALRDGWSGGGSHGPLHRWALPARLRLTAGDGR